jgi:hypothetical protein
MFGVSVCYNGRHDKFTVFPRRRFPIMMPTSKLWPLCALLLLGQSALVSAQTAQTASPTVSPGAAPPQLEQIEEGSDVPITINAKPAPKTQVSEHREQGQVTEVKVTSGGSTYYLKPNPPTDTASSTNRGPQWRIMEFDLGSKKKKQSNEEVPEDTAPPPPSPEK